MKIPPLVVSFQPPDFWQLNEIRSSKPWSYPLHRHDGYGDLTLVCEGEIISMVNGKSTLLRAGTLSWTREQDLHEVRGTSFRYLNLNLADERLEVLALALGRGKEFRDLQRQPTPPHAELGEDAPRIEQICKELMTRPRGPLADLKVNELAVQFLTALLAPVLTRRSVQVQHPQWLEKGLQHVQRHIEDGVTVSELPEVCGRSPEHISRSFKKYLGLSPSAWINRQRIARASLLLSSTNRELLDICYSVGFQSASYFHRQFKHEMGVSPNVYRETHPPIG